MTKGDEYAIFKLENFYSWFSIFGVLVFALNAYCIEKLTATGFSKWATSILIMINLAGLFVYPILMHPIIKPNPLMGGYMFLFTCGLML